VRSPFLDPPVVEFTAGLGQEWKYGWRETKRVLRSVAARYLPVETMQRPKQGFAVPVAAWLKGPLRGWMEDLLLTTPGDLECYVRPASVRAWVAAHVSGQRDLSQQLWALMVLSLWSRRGR
jgi:asparagine synthase (glutamine-hydrolysing)